MITRSLSLILSAALALVGSTAAAQPLNTSGTDPATTAMVSSDGPSHLVGIRVGAHDGYDRIVLDFQGSNPQYDAKYVPQLLQDGSGRPVDVAGNAFLQITMQGAAAHDEHGHPTYTGAHILDTPSLKEVKAVALTGDFESVLTVGLGIAKKDNYSISTLSTPTRLIIDVRY